MEPTYDATASLRAKINRRPLPASPQGFADLPDLYRPPRRRLPPMVMTALLFLGATAVFYSAESVLPVYYKPSRFVGGYDRAIAQAKTEGELTARIGYDAKLKVIETQAVQWQEACKAGLQNWNNFYQAAYTRANEGYRLVADLQKQRTGARIQTAQSGLGGEIGIANGATTLGYLLSLVDPVSGQKTLDFAEQVRQSALKKLDDAAASGTTVSSEGWNVGLPEPTALPAPVKCEIPAALTTQPVNGG